MAKQYLARDWYWVVGNGPANQVYASARFIYVATNDAQYLAFLADGNFATTIALEADLRDLLNVAEVRFLTDPLPPVVDARPRVVAARCRLQVAAQSIATATGTAILFDTELVDPIGMHANAPNPDRIVIPETGWYLALGGARFVSNGTGYRAVQLRVGAAQIVAETTVGAATGRDTVIPVTDYFQASAGDILRMFVEQNSGVSLNVGARITVGRVE